MKMNVPLSELTGGGSEKERESLRFTAGQGRMKGKHVDWNV